MGNGRRKFRNVLYIILISCCAVVLLLMMPRATQANIDAYVPNAQTDDVTPIEGLPREHPINSGDAEELDLLPGIGTVLANRIIENRTRDGLFFFIEDLTCVQGIGDAKVKTILEYLEAQQNGVNE